MKARHLLWIHFFIYNILLVRQSTALYLQYSHLRVLLCHIVAQVFVYVVRPHVLAALFISPHQLTSYTSTLFSSLLAHAHRYFIAQSIIALHIGDFFVLSKIAKLT